MILGREPVAIAGVVAIAINLAISFGLNWSAEQVSLVNAFVVGVLFLIARQNSTPVHDPLVEQGTEVHMRGTDDTVVVRPTPPGPVVGEDAGAP